MKEEFELLETDLHIIVIHLESGIRYICEKKDHDLFLWSFGTARAEDYDLAELQTRIKAFLEADC